MTAKPEYEGVGGSRGLGGIVGRSEPGRRSWLEPESDEHAGIAGVMPVGAKQGSEPAGYRPPPSTGGESSNRLSGAEKGPGCLIGRPSGGGRTFPA